MAGHEQACRQADQGTNGTILKLSPRSTILHGQIDDLSNPGYVYKQKTFFIKNIFCRNFYFDEILISIDGIYILTYVDHEKLLETVKNKPKTKKYGFL